MRMNNIEIGIVLEENASSVTCGSMGSYMEYGSMPRHWN